MYSSKNTRQPVYFKNLILNSIPSLLNVIFTTFQRFSANLISVQVSLVHLF